jgi:hypothetical protein
MRLRKIITPAILFAIIGGFIISLHNKERDFSDWKCLAPYQWHDVDYPRFDKFLDQGGPKIVKLLQASDGSIWSAGHLNRGDDTTWIVRMSPNGDPGTWKNIDRFTHQNYAMAFDMDITPNGIPYVVGVGNSGRQRNDWITRALNSDGFLKLLTISA